MLKQNKRAQEIRDLAKQLVDAAGGSLTLPQLQEAVAQRWYEGVVKKVRRDYLLITLFGHRNSSITFMLQGDVITVTTAMPQSKTPRISPDDFVYLAIDTLPWSVYRGAIHTVNSRFNAAFRVYYPDLDPVTHMTAMCEARKIWLKPTHGGVLIARSKPSGIPASEEIFALMGLV